MRAGLIWVPLLLRVSAIPHPQAPSSVDSSDTDLSSTRPEASTVSTSADASSSSLVVVTRSITASVLEATLAGKETTSHSSIYTASTASDLSVTIGMPSVTATTALSSGLTESGSSSDDISHTATLTRDPQHPELYTPSPTGTGMMVPTLAGPSSTSTARGPLSTVNLSFTNLKECTVPSVADVPVDEELLHDIADPNRGIIETLDPLLWNALAMDDWLTKLVDGCPALQSGDNWSNPDDYEFPVALGKLMIDQSENIKCADFTDCTWSGHGNNFFGNDRPPKLPSLTPAYILNFRKWYALSALHEIHFYFRQMKYNFEQAETIGSLVLPQISVNLNPKPKPEEKGISTSVWLDIASAVVSFTPLGSTVSNFFNSLKSEEKIKKAGEALVKGVKLWKPFTSTNLKGAAKAAFGYYKASNPGDAPDTPPDSFETYADFAANFAGNMDKIASGMAQLWYDSMYGPPGKDGGYLQMVAGGAFSGAQTGTPSISDNLRKKYQKYIIDKFAQQIWQSKGIYIYKDSWDDQASCQEFRAMEIPGQACYPDPTPGSTKWIRYLPLAVEPGVFRLEWYNHDWVSYTAHRDWYSGFAEDNIYASSYNSTWGASWKEIYEGSADCFTQTNQDWLSGSSAPPKDYENWNVQGYPNTYAAEFTADAVDVNTDDPNSRTCHWNIPVLDADQYWVGYGCRWLQRFCLGQFYYTGTWNCPNLNNYEWSSGDQWGLYDYHVYGSMLFSQTDSMRCDGSDPGP